jgi:hypothetical protein
MNQNIEIEKLEQSNLLLIKDDKILELKMRIQKLSQICQELNPYQEISPELKMKLKDFQILELSDPFRVTNTLLMLLEDAIDELHVLCPLDEEERNNEIL